jgi:MYXO-CTERM domain-containing protein
MAATAILALGVGCGSSAGGCGALQPLPAVSGTPAPAPFGLPSNQVVEGGLQARVTKSGMAKLTAIIPSLIHSLLGQGACLGQNSKNSIAGVNYCDANQCANNTQGCPAFIYFNSSDRPDAKTFPPDPKTFPPPPGGDDDKQDGIKITVNDSATTPSITVDATFDAMAPIHTTGTVWPFTQQCEWYLYTAHLTDNSQKATHVIATINLGVDPKTGELTISLGDLQAPTLNLKQYVTPTGGICSLGGTLLGGVLGLADGFLKDFLVGTILKPALNNAIQGFLPKPLGLAGTLKASSLLASMDPPADANLELFIVPGGYVQTSGGGLSLGVMSGANSDRDQTTRDSSNWSEPSLCVPARMPPALGGAPFNLPPETARMDFLLSPAGPFSGNPDPVDGMGNQQDVAIGLSRTFLDLIGFHFYNSGTMCLHIGGASISQLNIGTLKALVKSLTNIVDDSKAPLELVLRPQTPLTFQVGAGTTTDSNIKIAANDLRIDMYGWIEERWVRLLTMSLDLNLGINLTFTHTADGKPAIAPMLVGLDPKSVKLQITNTDLLGESPDTLKKLFPSILGVAFGAIGGALGPITLPAVAGFSLDQLSVQKVSTSMDDFVAIYGNIVTGAAMQKLIPLALPTQPVGTVKTAARISEVNVPTAAELQALFAPSTMVAGVRPTVRLELGGDGAAGQSLEWGWRIDHGMWRPWTREAHPLLSDDAFLLQGHHVIEVRARVVDQWATEDLEPVALPVLIDSIAPELHPTVDKHDGERLLLGGVDYVSDSSALKYAWLDNGQRSAFSAQDWLSLADVERLTAGFSKRLELFAMDEAGNIGQLSFDATLAFHGRSTAPAPSGCGCTIGGADDRRGAGAGVMLLALVALVWLWRQKAMRSLILVVAAASLFAAGCGCENKAQCTVADDCSKMQCTTGQVPTCMSRMCACAPDLAFGDVGRFASMTLINGVSYVAAYNNDYGDLMVGNVTPPGVVSNWDFVDGVPDSAPDLPNSHVRGGVSDPGDDVGRYASIAQSAAHEAIVAYYDKTHGALKFTHFGAVRWEAHTVDKGLVPTAAGGGDEIGRWTALTVGPDGLPAIAYSAIVQSGPSGMPEGQLRWAQAKVANPHAAGDWTITVVDSRPLAYSGAPGDAGIPGPDMTALDDAGAPVSPPPMVDLLLPDSIAIMSSVARKSDGTPGIAYYDRKRGNLRLVEWNASGTTWGAPVILDGEDANGNDLGDVGLYNSFVYDDQGVGHISYENATLDSLFYLNTQTKARETVDNGYRPSDETTQDGLPSPVWHLVGDSSSIGIINGTLTIAYQDSTALILRSAQRDAQKGTWTTKDIAGHMMPFTGAYGFYANLRASGKGAVISSYAINQQTMTSANYFVQVFAVGFNPIQ